MLVINWVIGKFRIHNLQLTQVLHEVIRISDMFKNVEFKHIYRERNAKVDDLAKAGANVQNGYWHIYEFHGIERFDSYQFF